jgi:methylated-DNA-[protein]-cysteine S-methyltransferase
MKRAQITVASPLGPLTITEIDGAITAVDWKSVTTQSDTALLLRAAHQLHAYFYCELKAFDLPVAPAGSDFNKSVWDAMCTIPFGRTRSYGEIAAEVGNNPRAVGVACGANPIPIIIPCHRIIGGDGGLGGYSGAGGVATKRFLLELEGVRLAPPRDKPVQLALF